MTSRVVWKVCMSFDALTASDYVVDVYLLSSFF